MAIKVIVNYPQTEEGMEIIRNRQAEVVAKSLIKVLTEDQLSELVMKLTLTQSTKEPFNKK